jgi:hypothetical protein
MVVAPEVELNTYQQSTFAVAQPGACTHVPPPETALTVFPDVCTANIAINMCPVPVGATVTAHEVPVDAEQRLPLVTCCTWVIAAWTPQQNSKLMIIAFMLIRLPCVRDIWNLQYHLRNIQAGGRRSEAVLCSGKF